MIDLQLVLQEVLDQIHEAPTYLILVWLGGVMLVLAQVVGSDHAVNWSLMLISSSST